MRSMTYIMSFAETYAIIVFDKSMQIKLILTEKKII
jgi:hypothetical protein